MGIGLINVCLCVGTLNLTEIVIAQLDIWLIFPLFPVGIMFFIGCLAETNRHPFDLPIYLVTTGWILTPAYQIY